MNFLYGARNPTRKFSTSICISKSEFTRPYVTSNNKWVWFAHECCFVNHTVSVPKIFWRFSSHLFKYGLIYEL